MVLETMPVLSVRSDLCQVKPHRSHVLKTVNAAKHFHLFCYFNSISFSSLFTVIFRVFF